MAIKERRIKCASCGERDTVMRGERGPVTAYCDFCREERTREQARERMRTLWERQRGSHFHWHVRVTELLDSNTARFRPLTFNTGITLKTRGQVY